MHFTHTALVVDDDPINLEILADCLSDLNIDAVLESDSTSAVDQFLIHAVDIVLVDIEMPLMNGFQLAAEIRKASARGGSCPIVAVSGHTQAAIAESMHSAEINAHISKPLNNKQIAEVLLPLLGLQQTQTQSGVLHEQTAPLELEGFDLAPALARQRGNWERIKRFIISFSKNSCLDSEEVDKYLTSNNLEALQRLFHKVKGSAANVGATRLSAAAADLEDQLRDNGTLNYEKLDEFRASSAQFIGVAQSLEREDIHDQNSQGRTDVSAQSTLQNFNDACVTMLKIIDQDIGEVDEILERLSTESWPQPLEQRLETINQLFNQFLIEDFKLQLNEYLAESY